MDLKINYAIYTVLYGNGVVPVFSLEKGLPLDVIKAWLGKKCTIWSSLWQYNIFLHQLSYCTNPQMAIPVI